MDDGDSTSGLYRPNMEAQSQSFDDSVRTLELHDVEQFRPTQEMDDFQLVGVPVGVAMESVVGGGEAPFVVAVELKMVEKVGGELGLGKRRRGRPPRGQEKPPPSQLKKNKEEEDVCFICFDGGNLVLCDRKGCPKAYHPACIKRDEAFFRSKAKWSCGWHICTLCQKAAHFMCYTCTYSLCKRCTKNADYLCVRGNMGFCTTCMRTVMLIENSELRNGEMIEVDFDDKSSWWYLFKIYWSYLKEKLSLTLNELTQAKNPWKEAGILSCKKLSSDIPHGAYDGRGSISVACNGQPFSLPYGVNDGKSFIPNKSSVHGKVSSSETKRAQDQFELLNKDSLRWEISGCCNDTSLIGCKEWASKELLEFVAHMKNGDTSVLSQSDVQALLLDYIKRNNLRDPRQKSQIICDLRLKTLFGKPCLGHIEMLKLLECHFLIKEDSCNDVLVRARAVDAVVSQVENDWNNGNLLRMGTEKKCKTRKKGEEKMQQINLDEYAAIDVHNINLIYLQRSLIESLIEDNDKFHDKVVGSIVRIRISSSDQKQDTHRLVQVVGTNKVAVPYKIGGRTSDIMLEVLNLDKKESISIDAISNQEFSEDECRRFRQSIRCGLVKQLTVGEIQEKAMALQAARLDDWLETEILRLNHLRDRASEKGHKKELRECVEKLQLLKTPEERQRRLHEIPEVHADPKMDPSYESEEDAKQFHDKRQDEGLMPKYSVFNRNQGKPMSPRKRVKISNDAGQKTWENSTTCEGSRNLSSTIYPNKEQGLNRASSKVNEGKDACESSNLVKTRNQVDSAGSTVGGWNTQSGVKSGLFFEVASETSAVPLSTENTPSANNSETEKLWHYRDPNGIVQGPFCMMQLRKWSTTGLFPANMGIWTSNEQHDSLLLTDALNGRFHKVSPSLCISSESRKVWNDVVGESYNSDVGWNENMSGTGRDGKQNDGMWHHNNVTVHSSANNGYVRSDVLGSQPCDWTRPGVNQQGIEARSSSQQWDSSKANNICSQMHSPLLSAPFSRDPHVTLVPQGGGCEGKRWNSCQTRENWNSHGTLVYQVAGGQSQDNLSNSPGCSGQSSGQNWRSVPLDFCSKNLDSNSAFISMTKSTSSEQNGDMDVSNLPSPTPKENKRAWECEAAKHKQSISLPFRDRDILEGEAAGNKHCVFSDVSTRDPGILEGEAVENKLSMFSNVPAQGPDNHDLPSSTPEPFNEGQKGLAADRRQSVPSDFPVQGSGPSWSSASSLVVSGTQIPEMADEWTGYSPNPPKPSSVEEWDSAMVSASSLKCPEAVGDHVATPTSNNDHLTHSSPAYPAANVLSWQAVNEPIELSTLAEELVSDLLAEADALESQSGLASPTSVMRCGEELIQGSKNDCFSSIEELSPPLDAGKSDALSSTGDVQFPCLSTPIEEADVFDPFKRSSGQSLTSIEMVGETKSIGAPGDHGEAGSDIKHTGPSTFSLGMVDMNMTQRAQPEALDTGWEKLQVHLNMGRGRSAPIYTNIGSETSQATARWNANSNFGNLAGSLVRDGQRKYTEEIHAGSRDLAYLGGDSGFSRGGSSWSRQYFGGGGGYSRPLPKAQRICKFYESGYCKKGAMCNYRHP